jgi:hypothetical protein
MDSKKQSQENISRKRKIQEFIIDETLVRVGWFPICPAQDRRRIKKQVDSRTEHIHGKKHAVAEVYGRLGQGHGRHPVSTDGGTIAFLIVQYMVTNILISKSAKYHKIYLKIIRAQKRALFT